MEELLAQLASGNGAGRAALVVVGAILVAAINAGGKVLGGKRDTEIAVTLADHGARLAAVEKAIDHLTERVDKTA